MVKITSNRDEIERKLDKMQVRITDTFLERLAIRIESRVIRKISELGLVDTGRFRASVRGRRIGPNTILISDGVTYGIYLELGTGIYGPEQREIVRKVQYKPSMRTREIRIKGITPREPFKKALQDLKEDIDREIQSLLNF